MDNAHDFKRRLRARDAGVSWTRCSTVNITVRVNKMQFAISQPTRTSIFLEAQEAILCYPSALDVRQEKALRKSVSSSFHYKYTGNWIWLQPLDVHMVATSFGRTSGLNTQGRVINKRPTDLMSTEHIPHQAPV